MPNTYVSSLLTVYSAAEEKSITYGEYKSSHSENENVIERHYLSASEITDNSQNVTLKTEENKTFSVMENIGDWVEWNVQIEQSAYYNITAYYKTASTSSSDISVSLEIDGDLPYKEAMSVNLPKVWIDVQSQQSVAGKDDTRPVQKTVELWQNITFRDNSGLYSNPYEFYLTSGYHTVKIKLGKETVQLSGIELSTVKKVKTYSEYISQFKNETKPSGKTVRIEAEKALYKSSSMLYPTYDKVSASTLPNDPVNIRLNTIGAGTWSTPGQKISWKIDVPKDGLYQICFKARQNTKRGLSSYRNLYINGEIPFSEAENIAFHYDDDWYNLILGGKENACYFYLKKGDIISLECTSGPTDEVLQKINNNVNVLNTLYRKLIQISGVNPDIYRDYTFTDQIPDLLKQWKKCRDNLSSAYDELVEINGQDGAAATVINKMVLTLDRLIDEPDSIAERLSTYVEDIQSLASLINEIGTQPLELDCIALLTKDGNQPQTKAKFNEWFVYFIKKFISSFSKEYMSSVNSGSKSISVWVTTGRDQANVISDITKDLYTGKTGVEVNYAIVDTGTTLIRSVLAGKGPDAAIMVAMDSPINLAMRGALVDLQTVGLDEKLMDEFSDSAWSPFKYKGGIYAIPETQNFDVLFYRKDIIEEYGLSVPETWDEFYSVMRVLQNNNLIVGLNESIVTFNSFLFQNGGKYYNDNLTETLFDTNVAYDAFERWTQLYSKYGVNRTVDFFNRFRNGEMPIGISGFSACNQFYAASPELNGLWGIAPIPGTLTEDGTVDRSESSTLTSAIVINTGRGQEVYKTAYDFISWWTGYEAQSRYALDIEATLGIAARYSTANLKALKTIPWDTQELEVLETQIGWLYNNPEIPGNYIVSRCISNAFRSTVDDGKNARRQLSLYNREINEEITRKRKEFSTDLGDLS